MSRDPALPPSDLRRLRGMAGKPFELHDFAALGAFRFLQMMRERGALGFAVPSADRNRLAWALLDLGGTLTGRAVHGDVEPWPEWTAKAMLRAEAARAKVVRWMPEGGMPVDATLPAIPTGRARRVQPEPTGTVVVLRPKLAKLPAPGTGDDEPPAA